MLEVRGQELGLFSSHRIGPQWFKKIVIMTNLGGDINTSVLMS